MAADGDTGDDGGGPAVLLDHWIFGRPRTMGYRVMAVAKGLNLTLYESKLKDHYTPLRGIVSDSVEKRAATSIRMVHPVADNDEVILSVLKPGLQDEAGRDTYVNHSVVLPMELLRDRRLSFAQADQAVADFDKAHPGVEGEIDPIRAPLTVDPSGLPAPGVNLRKRVSKAAVENLGRRWASVREGKTLLYLPKSEDDVRVQVLYDLLEVMCVAGKLPVPISMSDVPPVSQLEPFQVLVSPRGTRTDQRWALIEASTEQLDGSRSPQLQPFFQALDAAYRSTPRIVGMPPAPKPPAAPPPGAQGGPPPSSGPGPPSGSPARGTDSGPSAPVEPLPLAPGAAPRPVPSSVPPSPASPPASAGTTLRGPSASPAVPPPSAAPAPPAGPLGLEGAHARVKGAFQGFIGNSGAVERIGIDLVSALMTSPVRLASSYLITGNPSTGKTTLAQTMAKALGLPLVILDGPSVSDREALVGAIDASLRGAGIRRRTLPSAPQGVTEYEYPPVLVFLDEVQLIPRKTQESLLTLTEPDMRYVRLDTGICRFPFATFVAATTRPQAVDRALRSRFNPEVHLNDYTREEVAEIVGTRYPDFPEDIRLRLAVLSQLIPRIALRLARDLQARQRVSLDTTKGLEDHLADLERAEELDSMGFGPLHRRLLRILQAQNAPVGLETLLNVLGESDRLYVEREILAGLQRAGFVVSLPTGRAITADGLQYLESFSSKGGASDGGAGAEAEGEVAPSPSPLPPSAPAGATGPDAPTPLGTAPSSASAPRGSPWNLSEPISVLESAREQDLWSLVGNAGLSPDLVLGFTREGTARILSAPGLGGITLYQISRVDGESTVSPTDLERIGSLIEHHFSQSPGRAAILPGVEGLVEANNLNAVRRLLELARDFAQHNAGAFLFSVNPRSVPREQLGQIEQDARRLP